MHALPTKIPEFAALFCLSPACVGYVSLCVCAVNKDIKAQCFQGFACGQRGEASEEVRFVIILLNPKPLFLEHMM